MIGEQNRFPGGGLLKATIRAVAEAAGVSITTVSFVLNNRYPQVRSIPVETRERIRAAAATLGYRKNPIAASLRTGRPLWMGVMMQVPEVHTYATMWATVGEISLVSGVQRALSENGFFTLLGSRTTTDEVQSLETLASAGVGGIILKSASPAAIGKAQELREAGLPVVVIFPSRKDDLYPYSVDLDNYKAGRTLAEMFIRAGRTSPMYVFDDTQRHFLEERERGFCERIEEEYGRPPLVCALPDQATDDTKVDMLEAFLRANKPDAAMGVNTGTSVQLSLAADRIGLSLPDDLVIIGFDCQSFRGPRNEGISAIGLQWSRAGRAAVQVILDHIRSGATLTEPVLLEPEFMPGDTTPPELAEAFAPHFRQDIRPAHAKTT